MNEQDDFETVIDKYSLWDMDDFKDAMPEEIDQEAEYDAMLNECHGPEFKTPPHWKTDYATEYQKNDPVGYRCGFADYGDTLTENYFEGPDETFYPVEKTREAINDSLDTLIDQIENDKI